MIPIKLSFGDHWIYFDNHWKRIPHPEGYSVTFLSLGRKYYIFDHVTENIQIVSRDGIEINKEKPRQFDKYSQAYIVNQDIYIVHSVFFYEEEYVPYYCRIHQVHPNINFIEMYQNINLELIIPIEENVYILQYYNDRPKDRLFWPADRVVCWVKQFERDVEVCFVRGSSKMIRPARIYLIGFRIPGDSIKFSFAYKNGGIFFLLQDLHFIQIYFLPLENLIRSRLFEEIFLDCIYFGNLTYFRQINKASHITLIDNFPCTIQARNQDIFLDSIELVFSEHGSVLTSGRLMRTDH